MSLQNRPALVRDSKGRLMKGSGSLNPGGRPKMSDEDRITLKEGTKSALARLKELIRSDNEPVALGAIKVWLDRAWGKEALVEPEDDASEESIDSERAMAIVRAAAGDDAN